MSKNVLDFFRQDHGYKEGSYQKIWQVREDNEHLADILASMDADNPGFSDEVHCRSLDSLLWEWVILPQTIYQLDSRSDTA